MTPLDALGVGDVACALVEVRSLNVSLGGPVSALLTDGRADIRAVWFNPYAVRALAPGARLAVFGKVEYFNGLQLSNPEFERLVDNPPQLIGRIFPIYPASVALPQWRVKKLVNTALDLCVEKLVDAVPAEIRERHGMKGLGEALLELHHPRDEAAWVRARNRLAFDELFFLQAGLLLRRSTDSAPPSQSLVPGENFNHFMKSLPFSPTRAQNRAIGEILRDLEGRTPMNRLLQGDVGSGKTLVAVAAVLTALDAGAQAAFMVPTEILAQQHYMRLNEMLEPLGVRVGLLTSGLRPSERKKILAELQRGELHLLIGTHAIFSERVSFANLGLTIVDEQHRFGVLQRNALISKGTSPHVLVMTATPIPRTLVLSVYGDLEVSVLDELPPGRKPIETIALGPGDDTLPGLIRERTQRGQQVYWVCPLIEEGEAKPDIGTVLDRFQKLLDIFPDLNVAMLHGRLPMREKAETMRRFAEGAVDILVATVVVEVGVDVPNATMMIIEDAGQFGLAQLHQLRGRIGRGKASSLCVLLEGEGTPEGHERIEAMVKTSDGFALAELDLMQRGPGALCGVRQHGVTDFRVANLVKDRRLLELARREARDLLRGDPELKGQPLLREELTKRLGSALSLAGTA